MLALVLLLSRVIGLRVRGADGRVIGRLADLSVRLHAEPHAVEQFVVRRPHARKLVVPTAEVVLRGEHVTMTAEDVSRYEVAQVSDALAPDAILLKRDVLDTQIVDVVGQRLARVADVLLARTPDGGLQTVGVEVGFGGVLRRLRIGGLRRRRGIGDDVVAWSDLHLTSDRGHEVQLDTPKSAVHRLDARSLAALLSRVDTDAAMEILAAKEPVAAAEAVRSAHPDIGERLLRGMPAAVAARIVAAMPTEHVGHWRDRLAHSHIHGRHYLRSPVSARRHLNWPRP